MITKTFFLLFLFIQTNTLLARCRYDLDRDIQKNDTIFLGKTTKRIKGNIFLFEVVKSYKGNHFISSQVVVDMSDNQVIDPHFRVEVGGLYLIFSRKLDGKNYVDPCNSTGSTRQDRIVKNIEILSRIK